MVPAGAAVKTRRWQPVTRSRTSPWRALGWPGAAGCALLALAAVLGGWAAPQWRAATEDTRTRARALKAPPVAPLRQAEAQPWPEAGVRDARIDRLLQQARDRHLRVLSLADEAAPARAVAGSPGWDRVTLQLEGSYVDLRGFVAEALQADPALALDTLRLTRQEGGPSPLKADLTLALASRAPGDVSTSRAAP